MIVRPVCCCVLLLLLLSMAVCAQQPSTPPPASPQPREKGQEVQKEKEIEKKEQSSRMLGIMPMFSVTHEHALPMTPREKLHLAAKSAVDPFVFVSAGIQAGISQGTDGFHDYGQGAAGYGKRYGAALADASSSNLFSNFLYPAILKQDPRYFRTGQGSAKHRIGVALSQMVIGYKDSGQRTFNFSNVLGALSSGALSNVYYPGSDRGFKRTLSGAGISLMYGGFSNILSEYWPEIDRKIRPKRYKHVEKTP